ncbi:MAG TPA: DUF4340 domain-containing protein, partial [Vicinamibacteria bacterium]|nr:DUF4340 domain-containing protein [Vicinamibacteria bacterium]
MKGTFTKTAVLLAVALGVGAYAYFVERKKPAGDDKKKEALFTFENAKAKEFSLEPRQGDAIRLVKEAGSWKLVAPMTAPADGTSVDTVLNALNGLNVEEVVAETPAGLADFGLEKPLAVARVTVEGQAKPLVLRVGDKAPDGSGVYAQTEDKPRVFLIASWLQTNFEKKPFDFRDRDLLHLKRDDVRALEVTGPEGGFTLAKKDDGEWGFTAPLVTRAGRWSVDGLLSTLEGLRFDSIADEDAKDLKRFGLAQPARTVTASLADGSQRKLEIGSSAGEKKWHARDALKTLVAVIPGAVVDDLAKGMAELRQKRLLDVSTWDVEGIEAEGEKGKQVYARTTTKGDGGLDVRKWKRTAPDGKDLETSKVEDALFKIGGLDVAEFVDAPKAAESYGLEKPALRLTLRMSGGKSSPFVELAKKDGSVYARRSDDSAVLKLDAAKADELV